MEIESAIVTGGGFLGVAIVLALAEKHPECRISVLDIKEPPAEILQRPNIQYIRADTTCPDDLSGVFQAVRPRLVIHTAGVIPPLSDRYSRKLEKVVFKVNVQGTANVLDAAKEVGCSAFVFTSSCCAVIDDMSMPYMNIGEKWPASLNSSIYGRSKVRFICPK